LAYAQEISRLPRDATSFQTLSDHVATCVEDLLLTQHEAEALDLLVGMRKVVGKDKQIQAVLPTAK